MRLCYDDHVPIETSAPLSKWLPDQFTNLYGTWY